MSQLSHLQPTPPHTHVAPGASPSRLKRGRDNRCPWSINPSLETSNNLAPVSLLMLPSTVLCLLLVSDIAPALGTGHQQF